MQKEVRRENHGSKIRALDEEIKKKKALDTSIKEGTFARVCTHSAVKSGRCLITHLVLGASSHRRAKCSRN